ncbi:DUF6020 family protein [Alloscardovia criceti]|uniref:DUF6020 family protein n=1 Tax=Alloscardovia criceti TaxID=356828 RepID=UPI0003816E78|nr:DUF6020 family protein [Alloscardovia criceti]
MPQSRSSAKRRMDWASVGTWTLAAVASAWIALCTSVGPIYRADHSVTTFTASNAVIFVLTWLVCMGLIWLMVRLSQPESGVARRFSRWWRGIEPLVTDIGFELGAWRSRHLRWDRFLSRCHVFCARVVARTDRSTNRWWKIALIMLFFWGIQFVLVPTVFAADLMSQYSEMTRWITSLDGTHVSYAESFNVVDVYPIAHYMWPDTPTYLTNQHNVVLTFVYGGTLFWSQKLTGTIDIGLIVLSLTQMLFAVFAVSVTLNRFFTYARPLRVYARSDSYQTRERVSAGWRTLIILFFIFNPQLFFTATALTKSPLFAYAFLWWFGQWYEIFNRRNRTHIPRKLVAGIAISTALMLISAKYATYIIAVQIVLIFLTQRKLWRAHVVSLVLPFIIFQGALTVAVNTGSIISGDAIESRGIQIQQIARVMREDPNGVSDQVRTELRPIFNLYSMGASYFPNDADRVKSSGSDGKVETYKWETVTAEDMENFNKAWLELGKTHPIIYFDAFMAKVYGYFDATDKPYVASSYYVDNSRLSSAPILQYWIPQARHVETGLNGALSSIPVLGWTLRANFYVVSVLLIGCAVIILRRWKDLLRYTPLILLMGVMIMAPANNFERHMLPLVFVTVPMLIHFIHTARRSYTEHKISHVM